MRTVVREVLTAAKAVALLAFVVAFVWVVFWGIPTYAPMGA